MYSLDRSADGLFSAEEEDAVVLLLLTSVAELLMLLPEPEEELPLFPDFFDIRLNIRTYQLELN